MDTIAALNFGIIISLNIRALGMKSESSIIKETIRAGVIAGGILLLVYAALAHIGAVTGGAFGYSENGAQTLNQMVRFLFGKTGLIMLAAYFLYRLPEYLYWTDQLLQPVFLHDSAANRISGVGLCLRRGQPDYRQCRA